MPTPLVSQQLRLSDSHDAFRSVRWKDDLGNPYTLTSSRLVVRADENEADAVPPLLNVSATLSDSNRLATVIITKAVIQAVTFPSTPFEGVWEMVVTRSIDGLTESILGGVALWTPGVARP